MKKHRKTDGFMGLYLFVYSIFSDSFLTKFPFVHSDESWLAGLSRDMLAAGSLSATESFFDARPRYPHAVKSLFHFLQMGFLKVFGYSVDSVRLCSLIAGIIFLLVFYILMKEITKREKLALGITILFSLDVEFFYVSHFARQEIFLGLFLILGLLALFKGSDGIKNMNTGQAVWAAVFTGISVGFHPNSFLLACSMGSILLFYILCSDKRGTAEEKEMAGKKGTAEKGKPLAAYIGVTGGIAAFFVALSFSFDRQFLLHYVQNGAMEFDIDAPVTTKALELFGFFKRLFTKNSGTYYVTELRFSLLLFAFLMVFLGIYAVVMKNRKIGALLAGVFGLTGGMIFIGRYNQTGVFFFFPFGYLLLGLFLAELEKRSRYLILAGIMGITALISGKEIKPYLEQKGYKVYLEEIKELAPADKRVLANLNTGFYFEQGCLRDYRNLPYIIASGEENAESQGSRLKDYIRENKIEYILYSTELEYVYEHRPYFNVIYGDARFVPVLREFCEKNCELTGEFVNTEYGSRIIGVMGQEKYSKIKVYKVKGAGSN